MYKNYIKRALDIILSLCGIIILSPLLIVCSLIVKMTSRGPILFRQERVGKQGKLFVIYKYRTMRIDAPKDCPTHLLENPDMFITRIGKIMRKTSLDELPQMFNILKGDMSVIGPRPSLPSQTDLNELRKQNGSINCRPGLTGLAQINGRDELPISVKAEYDGKYFNEIGFFVDCKLFLSTIVSVFKSEGVSEGKSLSK